MDGVRRWQSWKPIPLVHEIRDLKKGMDILFVHIEVDNQVSKHFGRVDSQEMSCLLTFLLLSSCSCSSLFIVIYQGVGFISDASSVLLSDCILLLVLKSLVISQKKVHLSISQGFC